MTPILFSLLALTATFVALVVWAFSTKTQARWEQASRLPFDEAPVAVNLELEVAQDD